MGRIQISLAFLFGAVLSLQLVCISSTSVDKCLEGRLHKPAPSKEGQGYVDCMPWKKLSCCTAQFTFQLKKFGVEKISNFTWDHCGTLSKKCRKFMKSEKCFYHCEPNLVKWGVGHGIVKNASICSQYCDAWFEACKDDMTCSDNWLRDFIINNDRPVSQTCPPGSTCRTFAQTFTNGSGLCNKLWGQGYRYDKSYNCLVMDFKGPNNPNNNVTNNRPTPGP